jgi:hypothetical protein
MLQLPEKLMCGIAGIVTRDADESLRGRIDGMTASQAHCGKQNFVTPQSAWLKRELRQEVRALLCEEMLVAKAGPLNALRKKHDAYCAQPPDRGTVSLKDIFSPIALEIWMRRFNDHLAT